MSKNRHLTTAGARGRVALLAGATIFAYEACGQGTPTGGELSARTLAADMATSATLTSGPPATNLVSTAAAAIKSTPRTDATPATALTCEERKVQACPNTRWIAIKPDDAIDDACPLRKDPPPPPGWTARQLFRPYVDDWNIDDIPLGLRVYCLYEGPPPGVVNLTEVSGVQDMIASRDCLAVSPLATTNPEGYWPYLAKRFYFNAGAAEGITADDASNVRLTFIDTGPTNPDTPQLDTPLIGDCPTEPPGDLNSPCSPHGHALVNMSLGLLCGPGAIPDAGAPAVCGSVRVRSSLGLRYVHDGMAMVERGVGGGVAGFLGDVAVAIEREVDDWSGDGMSEPEDSLVVNLSLGWDPCFGGYEPVVASMDAGVQAVHAAIRDAACRGALVVGAAGNFAGALTDLNGDDMVEEAEQGSILPAQWETLTADANFGGDLQCGPALAPEEAAALEDPENTHAVYAVAGVRPGGRPLVTSRPRSFRKFAAFADHAGVGDAATPRPTGALTGSSVAAMVVSTTAAAIWSRNPLDDGGDRLSATEVMNLIHANSPSLPDDPDVCAPSDVLGACDVHRVKLCQVLNSAFPGFVLKCLRHPPEAPQVSTGLCEPGGPFKCPEIDIPKLIETGAACRGEFRPNDGSLAPCEHWERTALNATAWSGPQPGDNPCPTCGHKPGSGALLIDMDPNFTVEGGGAIEFSNVSLVHGPDVADLAWDGDTGASIYPFNLEDHGVDPLTPGTSLVVCLNDLEVPAEDSMVLTMTMSAGGEARAITVPVMRYPPDDNVHKLCPP